MLNPLVRYKLYQLREELEKLSSVDKCVGVEADMLDDGGEGVPSRGLQLLAHSRPIARYHAYKTPC
eukprot:5525570-Amphidinium_carterae.1